MAKGRNVQSELRGRREREHAAGLASGFSAQTDRQNRAAATAARAGTSANLERREAGATRRTSIGTGNAPGPQRAGAATRGDAAASKKAKHAAFVVRQRARQEQLRLLRAQQQHRETVARRAREAKGAAKPRATAVLQKGGRTVSIGRGDLERGGQDAANRVADIRTEAFGGRRTHDVEQGRRALERRSQLEAEREGVTGARNLGPLAQRGRTVDTTRDDESRRRAIDLSAAGGSAMQRDIARIREAVQRTQPQGRDAWVPGGLTPAPQQPSQVAGGVQSSPGTTQPVTPTTTDQPTATAPLVNPIVPGSNAAMAMQSAYEAARLSFMGVPPAQPNPYQSVDPFGYDARAGLQPQTATQPVQPVAPPAPAATTIGQAPASAPIIPGSPMSMAMQAAAAAGRQFSQQNVPTPVQPNPYAGAGLYGQNAAGAGAPLGQQGPTGTPGQQGAVPLSAQQMVNLPNDAAIAQAVGTLTPQQITQMLSQFPQGPGPALGTSGISPQGGQLGGLGRDQQIRQSQYDIAIQDAQRRLQAAGGATTQAPTTPARPVALERGTPAPLPPQTFAESTVSPPGAPAPPAPDLSLNRPLPAERGSGLTSSRQAEVDEGKRAAEAKRVSDEKDRSLLTDPPPGTEQFAKAQEELVRTLTGIAMPELTGNKKVDELAWRTLQSIDSFVRTTISGAAASPNSRLRVRNALVISGLVTKVNQMLTSLRDDSPRGVEARSLLSKLSQLLTGAGVAGGSAPATTPRPDANPRVPKGGVETNRGPNMPGTSVQL